MAIPVSNTEVDELARRIIGRLKNLRGKLLSIQTNVAADQYDELLDIPQDNEVLQGFITDASGLGINTELKAEMDRILNANITFSEIASFASALDTLAGNIETNASLFILSFDPTTKRRRHVTPVAGGVKTAILAAIATTLGFVS